jgi:hypothetical protein
MNKKIHAPRLEQEDEDMEREERSTSGARDRALTHRRPVPPHTVPTAHLLDPHAPLASPPVVAASRPTDALEGFLLHLIGDDHEGLHRCCYSMLTSPRVSRARAPWRRPADEVGIRGLGGGEGGWRPGRWSSAAGNGGGAHMGIGRRLARGWGASAGIG